MLNKKNSENFTFFSVLVDYRLLLTDNLDFIIHPLQ